MDLLTIALALITAFILRRIVHFFCPTYIEPDNLAILITGCDTGFGHHLAVKAIEYGFHVFACCLDASSDGAEALKDIGCDVIEMDVTDDKMVDNACAKVEEKLKDRGIKLHAIVNNAGVLVTTGPFEWNSPLMVEQVFNVNVMGAVRVSLAFLPLVRASKGEESI